MDWKAAKTDLKWRLKFELFRRVLPRLEYEPFAIKHISNKAWPKVAALSASNDYSKGLDEIDWMSADVADDGSDLVRTHAEQSRAVVLRGYAAQSELANWSMQDLAREMADVPVSVRVGDYLAEFGQPHYLKMPLAKFVNYLEGNNAFPDESLLVPGVGPYVGNQKIPKLAEKLPQTKWFIGGDGTSGSRNDLTTFWLGSDEAVTPLHNHHFCDTFLIQLIGRRRVTMIPPHEALHIGYMPQNINMGMASFDPYNPNIEQFPLADKISMFHIDLEPGDALLIPGFWFHAVKLSAPSLSGSRFARSRMPAALGGGPTEPWRDSGEYHRGW